MRPLSAHLTVTIAIDLPTSMRFVTTSDYTVWNCDFDALLDEATKNLAHASLEKWLIARPGVLSAPFDDGYSVSRLVFPALFGKLPVRGTPVVLALNAGEVFATGSEDVDGLVALAEIGRRVFELTKPMRPVPLTLDGDRWVEFVLAPGHPAKTAFDDLRYQFLIDTYEEQTAQLKALPGAEHMFVAAYKAGQKPGGPLVSMATLSLGLATLLPRTDLVGVFDPDEDKVLGLVPWDAFAKIVPSQEDADLAPPRVSVPGQLSASQREALRSAAAASEF